MLHWVGDEIQDEETEPYRISTEQCRRFLVWLKSKNTIRLENWEREEDFYALTIDDVPENFYYNAYPLLKEASIPFTLFVNVSLSIRAFGMVRLPFTRIMIKRSRLSLA